MNSQIGLLDFIQKLSGWRLCRCDVAGIFVLQKLFLGIRNYYRTRVRSLANGNPCHSLTDSVVFSRLVWCDPGVWRCQLKLVEVVTVANVDDEDRVGNSLLQIWELRFGHKAKLLFRLWAQGLVKILKLKFRQDFQAEVWEFDQYFAADVLKRL